MSDEGPNPIAEQACHILAVGLVDSVIRFNEALLIDWVAPCRKIGGFECRNCFRDYRTSYVRDMKT